MSIRGQISFAIRAVAAAVILLLAPSTASSQSEVPAFEHVLAPQPPPAANRPGSRGRDVRVDWTFENVDVSTLIQQLRFVGIEIPAEMAGEVTARLQVTVPLGSLTDAQAYQFRGTFDSDRLQIEGADLRDFYAELHYQNGVLELRSLRGTIAASAVEGGRQAGSFSGTASAQLSPLGDFEATLDFTGIPLGMLNSAGSRVLRGRLDGSASLAGPLQFEDLLSQLEGELNATVRGFAVDDRPPLDIEIRDTSLENGLLAISTATITLPETQLQLGGSFRLIENQHFDFQISADALPVETLWSLALAGKSPAGTDGTIGIDGRLQGELADANSWSAEGRVTGAEIRVAGFVIGELAHAFRADPRSFQLDAQPEAGATLTHISSRYELLDDELSVTQLRIAGWGGELSGTGTLALAPPQTHRVELQWRDILLTFHQGPLVVIGQELSFSTAGKLSWSAPADRIDFAYDHRLDAQFSIDQLQLNYGLIGQLAGTAAVAQGEVNIGAEGELFGGASNLEISTTVDPEVRWQELIDEAAGNGSLTLSNISIRRLYEMTGNRREAMHWGGNAAASLTWSKGNPVIGRVAANTLTYRSHRFLTRLDAEAILERDGLTIRSLRGQLAGGRVQASGGWSFGNENPERLVRVRVAAVNLSQLTSPIPAVARGELAGYLSGNFVVSGGRHLRATGSLHGTELTIYGMPATEMRSRLTATADLESRRVTARLRELRGSFAHGQLHASVEARTAVGRPGRFDFQLSGEAANVDFRDLIDAVVEQPVTAFGRGKLTGRFDLQGKAVDSADDWTGTITGNLGGTQASAVPGLSAAQNYLGVVSVGRARFERGSVRARIGNGRLTLQELVMLGDQLQVYAQGGVALRGGRMDVDAIINTGNFEASSSALATVAERYAIAAAGPLGFINEVDRLASNRTIFVHAGGSVARPQVRVRPLETATRGVAEVALRQFLGNSAGTAAAATWSGQP